MTDSQSTRQTKTRTGKGRQTDTETETQTDEKIKQTVREGESNMLVYLKDGST